MRVATGRHPVLLALPYCTAVAWAGASMMVENRPATFKRRCTALMGDWVMYKDIWTGEIPQISPFHSLLRGMGRIAATTARGVLEHRHRDRPPPARDTLVDPRPAVRLPRHRVSSSRRFGVGVRFAGLGAPGSATPRSAAIGSRCPACWRCRRACWERFVGDYGWSAAFFCMAGGGATRWPGLRPAGAGAGWPVAPASSSAPSYLTKMTADWFADGPGRAGGAGDELAAGHRGGTGWAGVDRPAPRLARGVRHVAALYNAAAGASAGCCTGRRRAVGATTTQARRRACHSTTEWLLTLVAATGACTTPPTSPGSRRACGGRRYDTARAHLAVIGWRAGR